MNWKKKANEMLEGENKKKYLTLIMVMLLLTLASIVYYNVSLKHIINGKCKVVNNMGNDLKEFQLENEKKISQTILIRENFDGIRLKIYANTASSKGTIYVQLVEEENNKLVKEWNRSVSEYGENEFLECSLDNTEMVSKETNYRINIWAEGINEQTDKIYFYCTKNRQYAEGELYVNQLKMEENDLTFNVYQIKEGVYLFLKPYYIMIVFVAMISMLIAFCFAYVKKECPLEKVFLPLILGFGIIYMVVLPPFSAPDEPLHYGSSYQISNFLLGKERLGENGNVLMRKDDSLLEYGTIPTVETYQYTYSSIDNKLDDDTIAEGKEGVYNTRNVLLHSPGAIGITIARILHLNSFYMIYFGRVTNLLFYTILVYFAIKNLPFGKMLMLTVSMTPMMLELISSYSCDVFINAVAFIAISFILKCIYQKEKIKTKDILLLMLISFFLAPAKLVYIPILFFVLLIPKTKFEKTYYYYVTFGIIMIVAVLTNLYVYMTAFLSMSGTAGTNALTTPIANTETATVNYSLTWCLQNPLEAFMIYIRTTICNVPGYIVTMFGWALGWLEIHISKIVILLYAIVFATTCFIKEEKIDIKKSHRILTVIVLFCSYALVLTSMFFAWTPQGEVIIQGVQGRYFLPIIPLVFIVLNNNKIYLPKITEKYLIPTICMLNIVAILNAFSIICSR